MIRASYLRGSPLTLGRNQTMNDTELISKVIDRLEDELYHVHSVHTTYEKLFLADDETRQILKSSDFAFFKDLQIIYLNYISVAIARLLDPESTGKKTNLTFYYLLKILKDAGLDCHIILRERLDKIKAEAYNFTEPRNALVAHLDFEINFPSGGKCVPSFISKEFDDTYSRLGEILNEVREKIGRPPSMFAWGITNHGHGRRLIHRLKMAIEQIEKMTSEYTEK